MNFCDELLLNLNDHFKDKNFDPYLISADLKVNNKKMGDTLSHLVRKKYLKKGKKKGEFSLTINGVNKISVFLKNREIKNKKWDGLWRVVIFDVPEKKRNFRKHVRMILYNLNFVRLQRSVWVTPYDVFEDLKEILPSVKRGDWIKLLLVKEISNQDKLKEEFDFFN